MKDDLKELRLVLHWRKLCQNREKWGKSIKPVKRKVTKGEPVAGRATYIHTYIPSQLAEGSRLSRNNSILDNANTPHECSFRTDAHRRSLMCPPRRGSAPRAIVMKVRPMGSVL